MNNDVFVEYERARKAAHDALGTDRYWLLHLVEEAIFRKLVAEQRAGERVDRADI